MGGPRVVLMGVSGSGKTTVGRALARRLGWPFLDADDLHSLEAIRHMAGGIPLTEDERWPWLGRVAAWIEVRHGAAEPGVIACSALRRSYRDRLRAADPDLRFVYLRAERRQIAQRLAGRHDHFFPARLLDSQFASLEEPGPDERAIVVSIGQSPANMVDAILVALAGEMPGKARDAHRGDA